MRIFSRGDEPPPAYLTGPEAQRSRQALVELFSASADRRAQTRVESEYLDLANSDLQQSLARLFRGKCAFCESPRETIPYRFRPPFEARPAKGRRNSHLFYSWLADAWENLFPICEECQPDDRLYFPVAGQRTALPTIAQIKRYAAENTGYWRRPLKEANQLLDPTNEHSLARHFQVTAGGEFFARSKRGDATLQHFRLDRPTLTEERAAAFAGYLTNLGEWLTAPGPSVQGAQSLFNFAAMPFGGGWYLLLRRILEVYLAREPSSYPLTEPQIRGHFLRFAARPNARAELDEFLEVLKTRDEHALRSRRGSQARVGEARLTKVSITNFKGIENLEFELAPMSALIEDAAASSLLFLGENAAGKSTLLEAIALALAPVEALNQLELEPEELRLDPTMMGAKTGQPADLAKVVLSFADGNEHALLIDRQFRPSGRGALPPVFAYGAFRQFRGGAKNYSASRAIVTLFQSDVLIGNPEPWLLKLDDETEFDEVARTLRVLLSGEEDFDVIRKKAGRIVLVTYVPQADGSVIETFTPLNQVSSGFRSVIAMACDIFRGLMDKRVYPEFQSLRTAAPVILIDEVEAHLHPRWKLQIMTALRRALPRATIIATSHDPLCLRGMGDGEVAVLHRVSGEATAKTRLPVLIEMLDELPDVTQLTVEQLLTSNVFGMFSTDAPATEKSFAHIGELLARRRARETWNGEGIAPLALTDDEEAMVARFAADIASSLPVGTTPAQALVEDAVAEYLSKRRDETAEKLSKLRDKARAKIVLALERL